MRFDWYQCTVDAEIGEVMAVLSEGEELVDIVNVKGRMSYTAGAEVRRGDYVLGTAFWGGHNEGVHVVGTGPAAVRVAEKIREAFPCHRVTRMDACEDYQGKGVWETLAAATLALADKWGIDVRDVGDFHRGVKGRTHYLGSGKSAVQVRVYEKGKQLGLPASPDWVRVEIQVRPKGKDQRERFASVTPTGAWAASRWSADYAASVMGVEDLEGVRVGTEYKRSDREHKEHWLARFYGSLFDVWFEEMGSAEAVGEYLAELLRRTREEVAAAA